MDNVVIEQWYVTLHTSLEYDIRFDLMSRGGARGFTRYLVKEKDAGYFLDGPFKTKALALRHAINFRESLLTRDSVLKELTREFNQEMEGESHD